MALINSNRKFIFCYIEAFYAGSGELTLNEILETNHDWEYIFSMQENLDLILDLKINERLQLKFNRDHADSDGFIKRIE